MLAASDFNCNEAARDKDSVRLWNEIAVDGEAIVAGEQREFRFVVADFYGKRSAVGICDVWRVGDDDVEGLGRDGREQIALKKTDSIGDGVLLCVGLCDGEGLRRQIDCRDARGGQLMRKRNGDGA